MTISQTLKDTIKKHITEEKDTLLQQVAELKEQDPFSDPDRLTDNAASDAEAGEESSHDRYEAMVRNLELRIKDLEKVLTELDDPAFNLDRLIALVPSLKDIMASENH